VDRCREGGEADRAGGGPLPGEELLLLEPCFENGDSVANVAAGSLEQARPDSRLEGEGREAVARRGRRDGRVVSPCPELADHVRRRDGPADAQPRQSVGLGQRPGRHDARVAAEEAGRLPAVELGAGVHLIGDDPRVVSGGGLDEGATGLVGQHRAGRVAGIRDDDRLQAVASQASHLVPVGLPPELRSQRDLHDASAERPGYAGCLHVGRHDDCDRAAVLREAPCCGEVRLCTPVRDRDALGRGTGIEGSDATAELLRPVRVSVAEHDVIDVDVARERAQLADRERMHAALRKVELDAVLPRGLPALELEGLEFTHHARACVTGSLQSSSPNVPVSSALPLRGTGLAAPCGPDTFKPSLEEATCETAMNVTFPDDLVDTTGGRIVLLVLDGLGGLPLEPGGPTELEAASTPNLGALARRASLGLHQPVGYGVTPGSGPGHLALFGYDPVAHNIGRGVLSALGVGFELKPGDVAIRLNLATVAADGTITDRRAGRPSDEENRRIIEKLRASVKGPGGVQVFFEAEKEHRAVLVLRGRRLSAAIADTDPQETGVPPLQAHARDPNDLDAVE